MQHRAVRWNSADVSEKRNDRTFDVEEEAKKETIKRHAEVNRKWEAILFCTTRSYIAGDRTLLLLLSPKILIST
jgi:hypothetical protein